MEANVTDAALESQKTSEVQLGSGFTPEEDTTPRWPSVPILCSLLSLDTHIFSPNVYSVPWLLECSRHQRLILSGYLIQCVRK